MWEFVTAARAEGDTRSDLWEVYLWTLLKLPSLESLLQAPNQAGVQGAWQGPALR